GRGFVATDLERVEYALQHGELTQRRIVVTRQLAAQRRQSGRLRAVERVGGGGPELGARAGLGIALVDRNAANSLRCVGDIERGVVVRREIGVLVGDAARSGLRETTAIGAAGSRGHRGVTEAVTDFLAGIV